MWLSYFTSILSLNSSVVRALAWCARGAWVRVTFGSHSGHHCQRGSWYMYVLFLRYLNWNKTSTWRRPHAYAYIDTCIYLLLHALQLIIFNIHACTGWTYLIWWSITNNNIKILSYCIHSIALLPNFTLNDIVFKLLNIK